MGLGFSEKIDAAGAVAAPQPRLLIFEAIVSQHWEQLFPGIDNFKDKNITGRVNNWGSWRILALLG
jgi:hypothetical protein